MFELQRFKKKGGLLLTVSPGWFCVPAAAATPTGQSVRLRGGRQCERPRRYTLPEKPGDIMEVAVGGGAKSGGIISFKIGMKREKKIKITKKKYLFNYA